MKRACKTSLLSVSACGIRPLLFIPVLLVLGIALAYALTPLTPGAKSRETQRERSANAAELAEQSRQAGLLTDWHWMGRYGHGNAADFARSFPPERWAAKEAAKGAARQAAKDAATKDTTATAGDELPGLQLSNQPFELVFPEGTFVLPAQESGRDGVFYALSRVYLGGSGEWNVYLESSSEAVVFVDGGRVLTRDASQTGAQRETIHAAGGYHMVMIKFVAGSAPFRVAILPPNSGSRRKNNTPYLQESENLSAALQ